MYYTLTIDYATMSTAVFRESHNNSAESLTRGRILPKSTKVPFEFRLEADEVDEDDEEAEESTMYAYYPNASIMDKRLVQTLKKAGVDNLQIFPAIVTNPDTKEVFKNYQAVNVIGMVSCADMAKSDARPLADVNFFLKLEIDPGKTRNALMFRLAESPREIIVHDKVASAIEKGSFPGVVLEPVSA